MVATFWAWAISAAVLIVLTIVLGLRTESKKWLGILIDSRGRVSLTHFQLTLWTLLILSLISGVFWGRLGSGGGSALEFSIPDEVLGLMGIAVASTVAATVTKSAKDHDPEASARIPVPADGAKPNLTQMFMVEEGALADKVIDITKFQNFVLTVILLVSYAAVAIEAISHTANSAPLAALPGLAPHFLTLLGISHAGYIAGKLPAQSGQPGSQLTVAERNVNRLKEAKSAALSRAAGPVVPPASTPSLTAPGPPLTPPAQTTP